VKKSLLHSTYKKIAVTASAVAVAVFCFSCGKVEKYAKHFFALDTVIDVTVYSKSSRAKTDIDSLEVLMHRIEDALSISRAESEIYRINHRIDSTVVVSDTLKKILSVCRSEFARSMGLFDVTVEPLKLIYGLESHQSQNHVPTARELDSVRTLIGFGRIRFVSDSILIIPAGMHLDFGGIAKGYVLIESQRFLKSKGYTQFLVNAGGDLIAIGMKPNGLQWNIGVQHPRNSAVLIATLSVNDHCVFTSGDYERCFVVNGKRYHHLFNPLTGIPGAYNMSATVVGDDPLITDAVVKTVFLMPPKEALSFLLSRNMQGFLIDSTGTGWASEGLRQTLHADSTLRVIYCDK
jgi:FAD:protein FMN transferase